MRVTKSCFQVLVLMACLVFACLAGAQQDAETTFCWQVGEPYCPPDFEGHFPDDAQGAAALAALWGAPDRDTRTDDAILTTVRQGLRRFEGDRMPLLRWLGNRYIWNQSPQHAAAVEIMYHAAECSAANADPWGTRGPAIYFGLSVVRPKTPSILRTLADISMRVDDPNDLSRIAWGIEAQSDEALAYLKPYLASPDPAIQEKAVVVDRIWRRELKAFDWARERYQAHAEKNFRSALPQLAEQLAAGTSKERKRILELVQREHIMLIMDDAFIEPFAKCATDSDPVVRALVARMVGEHWIWSAETQHPDAIALMITLSRDTTREVRYNAVYFGLSTVTANDEEVIRRVLEIAIEDRDPNVYERIVWGLRGKKEQVRQVLDAWIAGDDARLAEGARDLYDDMTG